MIDLTMRAIFSGFVAHAFQVRGRLRDGNQQTQITRGRLAPRDDGRKVVIDLDLHRIHSRSSVWITRSAVSSLKWVRA
jgi:hypothetical protein